MAERLKGVRRGLYESLVAHNVKGTWSHIIAQRGMFSYSGIPANVVAVSAWLGSTRTILSVLS